MNTKTSSKFFMAGTEGTGEYLVLLVTELGRVGIRKLGDSIRIRVEPANDAAADAIRSAFPAATWKQPGAGGQFRFSRVDSGYYNPYYTDTVASSYDYSQPVAVNYYSQDTYAPANTTVNNTTPSVTPQPAPPPQNSAAQEQFDQGLAAFKAGNYRER